MDLALINKHWKEGFLYPFPEKRKLYKQLAESLEKRLITSVVGLRRTGKTTLLKQLINKLIQEGVLRQDIVLYSFDDSADLQTVINEYLKISGQDLDKKKLFFFLDEIQKFPDWHNKLKMYYDHYPTIKFVVSGSSSIFIRKNSESLAGRIQEFWLPPLSFSEFLQFRGKKELIEQQKLFAVQIAQELETFTGRQFIEIINENKEFADAYLDTLIKKIIFEDIPQVYPIEQPQVLLKLFRIIASNPGMLIDYHNLSSDLGINEKTLSNYSYYLEMAFLIKKLYNYSSNQLTSEKKLKKVYPLASSFCQ
ncbi:MAG: ATP-binding protein, partial [Nanoarchaeota archaeon]